MRRLLLGLVLLAGCENQLGLMPMVEYATVPPAVKMAAASQRPDIKFRTAFRTPTGGYQLRGRDSNGRSISVDLTPEGNVLQMQIH